MKDPWQQKKLYHSKNVKDICLALTTLYLSENDILNEDYYYFCVKLNWQRDSTLFKIS